MKVLICDFAQVILLPRTSSLQGGPGALQNEIQKKGSAFLALNQLNEPLLESIDALQCEKVIFTAGTAHQAPEITQRVHRTFSKVVTTAEIGFSKSDPEAFKAVCRELDVSPRDCFFIDDMYAHVQAAQVAGLEAAQYSTVADAQTALSQWYQGDTMGAL